MRIEVAPRNEIGARLTGLGLSPSEIKAVVMTYLYTDHAYGLHHFPESDIFVHPSELASACGFVGRLTGYLLQRWPGWFDPKPVAFQAASLGPFDRLRPHRLEAQNVAISRLKPGFESPWGQR